jgi:hypothetical protein
MKFGVEFNARSISRWKNYNIDYNLLKSLIRDATTEFDDNNSSSDASYNSLNENQKKLLKILFKNFKDQIDFVSLFVFSKVGEISRRLSSLKRQCNIFIGNENDFNDNINENNQSDVSNRIKKRKLLLFHKELDSITKELQDLSRFLLLQKIAVKKLLKKFMKYSSFNKKQAFYNKITEKCLTGNPKSFVHLNLDDLSLETILLYDFLDTFLKDPNLIHNNNTDNTNKNKRQSSIHTIDSLQLTTKSYNFNISKNANDDHTQLFPRSTTFDIVSKRKCPRCLTFWVDNDNLDELKFLLSSEFKLITDDSLFTKDIKLKNTRSSLNLKENTPENTVSKDSNLLSNEEFSPETETVLIWLNNPSKFKFVQTKNPQNINYQINDDSTEKLNVFKVNPYSQILVSNTDLPSNNYPILITPIGGLRQFSIATLNENLVNSLFDDSSKIDNINDRKLNLFEDWKNSDLPGNKQMTQLSFNWVIDNNVKPLANVSSKKLRYINLNKSDKIDFYISLEWDIKINSSNNNDSENLSINTFPHAILEINFDIPELEFPSNILSLIDSYLVYPVDNFNFSLNNYLIYLYINENKSISISDDEMLSFIAPWHNLLEKDIRSLPEMRAKSQTNVDLSNLTTNDIDENSNNNNKPINGILLNKNDVVPSKPGYWNEFDNGSDFDADDDGGFYVYIDNENANNNNNNSLVSWFSNIFFDRNNSNSDFQDPESNSNLSSSYGAGLEWLSQEKANKILTWADNAMDVGDWIKEKFFGLNHNHYESYESFVANENSPLLPRNKKSPIFRTVDDDQNADNEYEDDETDSETEAMISSIPNAYRSQTISLLSKENHDKCLSFLYLTLVMLSLFTSSMGSIIIYTIFQNDKSLGQPELTTGLIVLITFAISCLILSILLTGFSICFLLFRYSHAPLWHFTIIWLGACLSTIFFFYGILLCFQKQF